MNNNGRLTYDLTTLAGLLGVSRNQVYTLAARDKLPVPVIRIGKRLLVSKAAVSELLNNKLG